LPQQSADFQRDDPGYDGPLVEQQFGDKVNGGPTNGSIFAAVAPEAFVKTFKHDYVRVNPVPDAHTALLRINHGWRTMNYNSEPEFPSGLLTTGVQCAIKLAECPV
jgi:hypothetical protein